MGEGIAGRSAIVTGAARGIGLAVARRLVRAGAVVVMADPDERRLEVEAASLNEDGLPGRAVAFSCNLREKLSMTNLLASALEAQDAIDILVDANLLAAPSDLLDPAADGLEAALAQNVVARLRLAQLAARRMGALAAEEDPPRDRAILLVGSIHGTGGTGTGALADLAALAASTAALGPLARGLALRLAASGVRVNLLAVGDLALDEEAPERATAPLREADSHEAAAEAALFLVSPAARAVTGQTLAADAGRGLIPGA
jgi:7-alpha-hydroxysteroid dehydrogenase